MILVGHTSPAQVQCSCVDDSVAPPLEPGRFHNLTLKTGLFVAGVPRRHADCARRIDVYICYIPFCQLAAEDGVRQGVIHNPGDCTSQWAGSVLLQN